MIEFQIVGLNRVSKLVESLSPKQSRVVYTRALKDAGQAIRTHVVKNKLSGQLLKRRTGNLVNSVRVIGAESGGLPAVIIVAGGGSKGVKYARIQERGGTVTPKRSKYLAIPLSAALSPSGVIKRMYDAKGGSLRNLPSMQKAFVMKSRSGNLLLVVSDGEQLTPLFVLKKSATIPGKRYMESTANEMKNQVSDIVVHSINRQVSDIIRGQLGNS